MLGSCIQMFQLKPGQDTTKSPVRKMCFLWARLTKWVYTTLFGVFSGKPLIVMSFSQIHTACLGIMFQLH